MDIYNWGKKKYEQLKSFKPATRALDILGSNPLLQAGFKMIPQN